MKYIKAFILIITTSFFVNSCNNNQEIVLTGFKKYRLDGLDLSLGLGLDEGCEMVIKKSNSKTQVQVMFNEELELLQKHIQGKYDVRNDTVFLSWEYIENLDKSPNSVLIDAKTIIYEYDFSTKKNYKYVFINEKTNCNTVIHILYEEGI